MWTIIFADKGVWNTYWKTIDCVEDLEMTHIVGGEASFYLRHYDALRNELSNEWLN